MNSLNSVVISAMGRFGILILLFLVYYVNALGRSDSNGIGKNPPALSHTITKRMDVHTVTSQPLVEDRIGFNQQQQQLPHNFDERVSDSIASSVLQFALDLGKELSRSSGYSTSEVFSPLSLISALAMLLLGAKGNSYQELSKIFSLDSQLLANRGAFHQEFGWLIDDIQQHPNATLTRLRKPVNWRNTINKSNIRGANRNNKPDDHIVKVANGLFAQSGYSINVNYRNVITSIYGSELVELDFQRKSADARNYINQWVNDKTFGKIPKIITDDISKSTNVILASVLYFKGFWENSFFDKGTTVDAFFPDGLSYPPIFVPLMATGGVFPFYNSIENDCRIIGMPYKGNLTTMYVIQPNDSTRDKLQRLQLSLTAAKIEDMISKMERKSAVIAFPKMHLVHTINMRNILTRFGIYDIFDRTRSDLSLIGGGHNFATPSVAAPSVAAHSASNDVPRDRFNNEALIFQSNQHQTSFNLPTRKPEQYSPETVEPIYDRFGAPAHVFTSSTGSQTRSRRASIYELFGDYSTQALQQLESERNIGNYLRSDFFVDDIVHKVDVEINEQGTEAAAATLTYLRRSGTDVVFRADTPFLILIRHDPTKVVLFYGIINQPQ